MPSRGADHLAEQDRVWQSIDWAAHVQQATVRGRRIRYADLGRGPAVILIHGQGGSWRWWLRTLPLLAEHGRIIAVDLPGFGESERIGAGDVFGEHVATVIGLLDHLGLSEAVVVGHSMGGLVSLRVACDHPDRVSGLLLTNAGGATLSAPRLRFIVTGLRIFNTAFAVPWVARTVARRRWLRSALFFAAVHDRRTLTTALAMQIIPGMASPGYVETL
ncbi:alpha/beta fold hydrolase, partial [Micromonospora sp. WMMD736]|uniref:alpha/beta fold hydrolase n=1 Tax=Micromonospora sp. WMMD736 TaxID=3404112 RepID=UPI003B936198